MVKEREIRELIFEQVRELYKLRRSSEKFVDRESKVPYAGHVYMDVGGEVI